MKFVKLSGGQIGLFVLLPRGAYAIDILRSLRVFVPNDPISNGLLNGVFKDGCNWSLLVKHWAHLRSPMKKLAGMAMACPDHPQLVLQPVADDPQTGDASDPILAIEITDIEALEERDPTGRRAMERQFMPPPEATLPQDTTTSMETAQVIDFCSANKEVRLGHDSVLQRKPRLSLRRQESPASRVAPINKRQPDEAMRVDQIATHSKATM